jgi:transcriptional regulator with XRE-family HTH domain
MTDLKTLLAANMKRRRNFLGISQARLAAKVNTSTNYIAMIEVCRKTPSFEMMQRIAAALDIDAPELFSIHTLPEETVKQIQEDCVTAFKQVIAEKLKGIDLAIQRNLLDDAPQAGETC